MSAQIILINNGYVGYANITVLSNINFSINKGGHCAVVGDSGSGKTSLLNMLAGNLQLTQGHISRYFGDGKSSPGDFHQYIAYVGAKPHFRNLSNTSDF